MELAEKDQRGMMRIESLHTLSDAAERILRHRAAAREQESPRTFEQMRQALESGHIRAVCVYDPAHVPVGFAAWRAQHDNWGISRAQVLILYLLPEAPQEYGPALVDFVFNDVTAASDLEMLEVRMRDDIPGVRAAWGARNIAFFAHCRLTRYLGGIPLPILPMPPRYELAVWEPAFTPQIERMALKSHHGMDAVVVPERSGTPLVRRLHDLQNGHLAGAGPWYPEASLVALHKQQVVGYIMLARSADTVMVVDHAITPQHRGRGLGRILLLRSLLLCQQQQVTSVFADVTRGNAAYELYARLGFQPAACGEVGVWWRDGRQRDWVR